MVEVPRASNGKFVSKSERAAIETGGSVTALNGGASQQDVGIAETVVDPSKISGGNDNGSDAGKRGPGRPKGSGRKEENKAQEKLAVAGGNLDLDSLNFTLFYAHALLAKAARTPEIALDETEAKTLATSAMNVMQHYNIKASQKAIDWGNLVLTMGIVYGGKFHAISERQKAERAAKKAEREATNAPFNLGV